MSAADESSESGAANVAIPRLVDEFGGQLYSLVFRCRGSREEAEDLVQEVFLQAIRS